MRKQHQISTAIIILVVACVGASLFYWNQVSNKRSMFWHLIRYSHGQTGAQQVVIDLADDLRGKRILAQMQSWSAKTMSRFDSGSIATNRFSPNWPIYAVVIASNDVPDFINKYKPGDQPEVAIGVYNNSRAQCVIIDWYSYGIIIGPTNSEQPYFGLYDDINAPIAPLYSVLVQPGVYVVWYDSK